MKKKNNSYMLLVVFTLLVIDILIRIFYCRGVYLKFNTVEFNNIATPIISFLGFVGVVVTIVISMKQFKSFNSEKYLIQFNEYIKGNYDEIKKGEIIILPFNKSELVKFFSYVRLEYEKLLEDSNYKSNQEHVKYKNFNLSPTTYEGILGSLRVFHIQSILLFMGYPFISRVDF